MLSSYKPRRQHWHLSLWFWGCLYYQQTCRAAQRAEEKWEQMSWAWWLWVWVSGVGASGGGGCGCGSGGCGGGGGGWSHAPPLSPIVLLGISLFQSLGSHTRPQIACHCCRVGFKMERKLELLGCRSPLRKCRFVHACREKVFRRWKSKFVEKPTAP